MDPGIDELDSNLYLSLPDVSRDAFDSEDPALFGDNPLEDECGWPPSPAPTRTDGPELQIGFQQSLPNHSDALGFPHASEQSTFNFDNLLAHAVRDISEGPIQLPWESNEWACIFDPNYDPMDALVPQFEPKLKVPKLLHDRPTPGTHSQLGHSSSAMADKPIFQMAVSRRKDQLWTEKRESELQRSLKKWFAIVGNWPDSWRCKQELTACATIDESMGLLGDYLSGKAPATLVKRANSMVFLHNKLHDLGYFWPIGEPDMYRLVKTLKAVGTSSSCLKSVLEAITFCRYSFDVPDLHDITVSKRCLGAIGDAVPGKVKQAAPLTVADVQKLHECLQSGDTWNRVFCGAALFCIFSRARWSDFVHGSCIRLDVLETDGRVAYADMEVQIHKTMRASSKRFKFLDLVASGQGICGGDWIKQWIHALSCIGVDPLVHSPGKSLMPAPADDGTALQRSLESDEASTWLRLLLGESSSRLQSNRLISSHSFKATILSMAAKRGLKHEDRLAMGHHAHPFKMADTYARDAQARVIRLVDKLLLEIQSGYFNPDCSRAGRFNKQCMPDPSSDVGAQSFNDSDGENFFMEETIDKKLSDAVEVVETQTAEIDEDHYTSSSSDSEAESVVLEAPVRVFLPPRAPEGYHFMQHRRTKTLHLVDAKFPSGTCCGRLLDQNFVVPSQLRYDSATCHVCKKHRMD